MRIRGWHIEGFGVFCDHRIEQLPDGMTVFLGLNEAGKSTLLAFLRGVLFGYPSGRSHEPQYSPLRGGRHGGKIAIDVDSQGLVTICRYAERRAPVQITLASGAQGSETELGRIFGGADRSLFQQVFAFSLSELQQLETLESEGVRDRIFSAGIAGAGRSAGDVIRRLDAEIQEIYVRRGRRTRVAELLGRREELTGRLREAQDKAAEYSQVCRHEENCLHRIQELSQAQEDLLHRTQRYRVLEELWPTLNQVQSARESLLRLETVDSFPPDPERRLSEANGNCRAAEEKLADLRAARQAEAGQCTRIRQQLNESLPEISGRAEMHQTELRVHREHLTNRPAAQHEVVQSRLAMDEALHALGPGWERSRVEAFDTSLPRTEQVRQWKERLATAAGRVTQAAGSAEFVERQVATAVRERERIQARLDPAGSSNEQALPARESALGQVISLQSKLQVLQAQADGQAALIEERKRAAENLQSPPATSSPTAAILVGLGAAVAGIAAFWRLVAGDVAGFVALLCTSALAAAAVGLLARKRPRPTPPASLIEAHRKAQNDHDGTLRLIHDVQVDLENNVRVLGLGDLPTTEQIAHVSQRVQEERHALDQWHSIHDRLQDVDDKLRGLQDELGGLRQALTVAQNAQVQVDRAWQQWKTDSGIPTELTPDGVLAFLLRVEAAREKIRAVGAAQETLDRLNEQIAAWQHHARELLIQADRSVPADADEGPVIDAFLELSRACRDDAQHRQDLRRLEGEIAEADAALETAGRQLELHRQRLQALLTEAGVQDEATFRAKHETFQQRRQLLRDIENWERTITDRLGLGPEAEDILGELSTGRISQWQEARFQAERDLEQTRSDHVEAVRWHQDAITARKAVEESADVPALELQIENVRCELTKALNEWSVKSIAKAIVQTTLRQFARDRQPTVLAEAGRTFQQVTGGRYQRIEQDPDGQSLAIVDRNLGRKSPEQLSRGTAEQLYLCLRLALAQEFGRQRCSLPVVMDDVLVNFDPSRARAMAQALADFARLNQILLFTCHPETVQALRETCQQIRVDEIQTANS